MIAAAHLNRPRAARRSALSILPVTCVALLGSALFPYPALSVGGNTGLQLSQVIAALVLIPALVQRVSSRCAAALYLALGPAALSAGFVVIGGHTDSTLAAKALGELAMSLPILVPVGWLVVGGRARLALGTVSIAILCHAAVGALQLVGFRSHTLPLLFLYHNPAFLSVQDHAVAIATWEQRPFGLFPEPSAMAATLGPWLCILAAEALRPRITTGCTNRLRLLMGTATLAGLGLLLASRSGAAIIIVSALVAIVFAWSLGHGAGHRRRSIVLPALLGSVLIAGLGTAVYIAAAPRVVAETSVGAGGSWNIRAQSLGASLDLLTRSPLSFTVGLGPGESNPLLTAEGVNSSGAIFSDGLRHMAETGALGTLGMLSIVGIAVYAISRSGARFLGGSVLVVWMAGLLLATSYIPLEGMWAVLGLLLLWDRLVPSR